VTQFIFEIQTNDNSVCTKAGDRVPGPRSFALMSPVEFPWREAVDVIEEVGSYDSYRLSLELSRAGLICGPSSGFNLQGGVSATSHILNTVVTFSRIVQLLAKTQGQRNTV
jgi:cysteine synthase